MSDSGIMIDRRFCVLLKLMMPGIMIERPKMTKVMYQSLKRHIMREREKIKQGRLACTEIKIIENPHKYLCDKNIYVCY